jgi:hypothetical protein
MILFLDFELSIRTLPITVTLFGNILSAIEPCAIESARLLAKDLPAKIYAGQSLSRTADSSHLEGPG